MGVHQHAIRLPAGATTAITPESVAWKANARSQSARRMCTWEAVLVCLFIYRIQPSVLLRARTCQLQASETLQWQISTGKSIQDNALTSMQAFACNPV